MNYWHITTWDGEKIRVKPENVQFVQDQITKKSDITTPTRTVIVSNIKDFVESDISYIEKQIEAPENLREQAAQAFKEPIITDSNAVAVKWVKRSVTAQKWNSHYSSIPAYHRLGGDDSHVLMAFKAAVHDINPYNTEECTKEEIESLR